jgi:hypothetical protein
MNQPKSQARQAGPAEYLIALGFVAVFTLVAFFCTQFVITGLPFEALAHSRLFDDAIWRAEPDQRPYMVADLFIRQPFKGLTKTQVRKLLGNPDGPYKLFEDYMIKANGFGCCTHLLILYDKNERVTEASISYFSNS